MLWDGAGWEKELGQFSGYFFWVPWWSPTRSLPCHLGFYPSFFNLGTAAHDASFGLDKPSWLSL